MFFHYNACIDWCNSTPKTKHQAQEGKKRLILSADETHWMRNLRVVLHDSSSCCSKKIVDKMLQGGGGDGALHLQTFVQRISRTNEYQHCLEIENYDCGNGCWYYMGIFCCLGFATSQYRPCSAKVGITCTYIYSGGILANFLVFIAYGACSILLGESRLFVLSYGMLITLSHVALMYPRVCFLFNKNFSLPYYNSRVKFSSFAFFVCNGCMYYNI